MELQRKTFTFNITPTGLFKDKLITTANCKIQNQEALYFTTALNAVEKLIISENRNIDNLLPINVVFSDGKLELKLPSCAYGATTNLVVYNIPLMRVNKLNVVQFVTVFIEELIHYFYQESNERNVKLKTFEAIKFVVDMERSPITIQDIYKGFDI